MRLIRLAPLFFLLLSCSLLRAQEAAKTSGAPDPREIIRQSVAKDDDNDKIARNYTFQKHVDRTVNGKREVLTYDELPIYGHIYEKLIARDGKPLSEKEAKKEQEKIDKFSEKLENESPEEREKRLKKQEEEHQRDREFMEKIPNAYDFKLVGSDVVNGHEVWMIDCTPRADFSPKTKEEHYLPKVKGRVYIDKKEMTWVKVEAELIDNISFGLFLANLKKGATMEFDAKKINEEVWLPVEYKVDANARLLFAHKSFDETGTFSNYRKYTAEAKIVGDAKEVAPSTADQPK
ncbi:MAG TPA: hypothetical protein VMU28_08260 [Terriglobales bacterium]|nr:hypothetical protein [Terriglobales bacterium]